MQSGTTTITRLLVGRLIYNSLKIAEEMSDNHKKYISELNEFLNKSSNHQALNAHIDVLFDAINEYKKS